MIPLDDWMEVELWEGQKSQVEVKLALPETMDPLKDESAAFTILKVGPGYYMPMTDKFVTPHVIPGDIVILVGLGAVQKIKMPNGKERLVAQARNVAYKLGKEDLEREDK